MILIFSVSMSVRNNFFAPFVFAKDYFQLSPTNKVRFIHEFVGVQNRQATQNPVTVTDSTLSSIYLARVPLAGVLFFISSFIFRNGARVKFIFIINDLTGRLFLVWIHVPNCWMKAGYVQKQNENVEPSSYLMENN